MSNQTQEIQSFKPYPPQVMLATQRNSTYQDHPTSLTEVIPNGKTTPNKKLQNTG